MRLVFQAYGLQEIMRQTFFSIASLLRQLEKDSPLKVAIYTDQPEYIQAFIQKNPRVETVVIDREMIKKWRGEIDFVHRVKIEILKDAGQRFPGDLFYCDGDTYFLGSPTAKFKKVDDKHSLMHIFESVLGDKKDPIAKKMNKFVREHKFQINGKDSGLNSRSAMWNAGVIGISNKNKNLLDDILALTDQMHKIYPKHVNEQLAVSQVLKNHTEISATDELIVHYWNQKEDYQIAVDKFLESFPSLERAIENYEKFERPLPPKKGLSKLISKIFGN